MKVNKKIIINIVILLFICIFVFCGTYKMHDKIENMKKIISNYFEEKEMHLNSEKIEELGILDDEENAWYTKYQFISHAGGGIDGKLYSNSLEAWELSYSNGNRVFDSDMMFTKDGELVLRHENINLELDDTLIKNTNTDYDGNGMFKYVYEIGDITYESFMSKKIYGKYTPMDLKYLLEYLAEHEDVYISADMKDDIKKSYQYLYDLAESLNKISVLDRIIVSIYNEEEYNSIQSIYDWKNYIVRQYINKPNNYYDIANFMINHDIHVMSVSQKYMNHKEIQQLEQHGIKIYTAVVDYASDYNYYKKKGISGCITNWLYENDWE